MILHTRAVISKDTLKSLAAQHFGTNEKALAEMLGTMVIGEPEKIDELIGTDGDYVIVHTYLCHGDATDNRHLPAEPPAMDRRRQRSRGSEI